MEPSLQAQQPQKNNFSWKRIGKVAGVIFLVFAAAASIYFLINARQVKIAWAAVVLNRHEYYLACEGLPFYPQVQKAMSEHGDIVDKLKAAGAASVQAEQINCPNYDNTMYFIKGDMLITYQTRSQRQAIEKLIGDNFFGIPYKGEPVK
jgi:hypothetical protein